MIMMGHPEAWEAAWGVVRLLGVVQLLGDLENLITALKPSILIFMTLLDGL